MDPTEHRGDASRLVDLLLRSCSLQPMDGLLLRLQFDVPVALLWTRPRYDISHAGHDIPPR